MIAKAKKCSHHFAILDAVGIVDRDAVLSLPHLRGWLLSIPPEPRHVDPACDICEGKGEWACLDCEGTGIGNGARGAVDVACDACGGKKIETCDECASRVTYRHVALICGAYVAVDRTLAVLAQIRSATARCRAAPHGGLLVGVRLVPAFAKEREENDEPITFVYGLERQVPLKGIA